MSAKLINHTNLPNENVLELIYNKLLKKTLIVVDRSTNKISRVKKVVVEDSGEICFNFDDEHYSSSFFAVSVGVSKQIHFEW